MRQVEPPLVLIADDDPIVAKVLTHHLESWNCRVATAANRDELLAQMQTHEPLLVLLDLQFGEHDGIQLLQELQQSYPNTTYVILTAFGSIDTAITAIRRGAMDYLTKPADMNRLQVVLHNTLERYELRRRIQTYEQLIGTEGSYQLVGSSPQIRQVDELINDVAPTDVSVLITGESGTGKELVARLIHQRSPRRNGPFIPLNMAALPTEFAESTLFGHERGSFSGADQLQIGCCEAADKGTLFLDEIGEMDLALQAKLLRFLQEQTFTRVGSFQTRRVDVRIIAATNHDPHEQIRAGKLREELYYRLDGVPIHLPPLREHLSDVPELAELFLRRAITRHRKDHIVGFSPETLQILSRYSWPGNVRQLENIVQRMVILCRGTEIDPTLIPYEIRSDTRPALEPAEIVQTAIAQPSSSPDGLRTIDQIEKNAIIEAMKSCKNNVREAARLLGLGQATVYRKLKKYGIESWAQVPVARNASKGTAP
jgi:two-component system response regulator HydG